MQTFYEKNYYLCEVKYKVCESTLYYQHKQQDYEHIRDYHNNNICNDFAWWFGIYQMVLDSQGE